MVVLFGFSLYMYLVLWASSHIIIIIIIIWTEIWIVWNNVFIFLFYFFLFLFFIGVGFGWDGFKFVFLWVEGALDGIGWEGEGQGI